MSPSHLTRRVFRRLLANQPVVIHRRCRIHLLPQPQPPARPLLRACPQHGRVRPTLIPARTFYPDLGQSLEDPRDPSLDPGMEKMLDLDKRIHLMARLPPQKDLVTAFNKFIKTRAKSQVPIEDFHATQLLQTLKTLENRHVPNDSPSLDRVSLESALQAMAAVPDLGYTEIHNKLAHALWNSMCNRAKEDPLLDSKSSEIPAVLLTVLCATGDTLEARTMEECLGEPDVAHRGDRAASWAIILAGFSKQNDETGLRETIEIMKRLDVEFSAAVARTLAVHYARRDMVPETKHWYALVDLKKPGSVHSSNTFIRDETVYQTLLEFCLRNREMEWGRDILKPSEASFNRWDAIFRASAATGRSVDEIDRMMAVMARRADESGQAELRPDIDTFNGLIRFAMSKKDAYLAERFFGLMEKWDVEPSTESYCLQIEYRIAAGDLNGAIASYGLLKGTVIENNEDWPVLNKLLQALVASQGVQASTIDGIIEDLADRRKLMPAPTALALCKYHIDRDQFTEVVEILNVFAYKYSSSQRAQIRDFMVDFTLNPETDTARAWDTYMIFHQIFDLETRRDIRKRVMVSFFMRSRPDLATHVFSRMSEHVRADTRPDIETYIKAFEGIAATGEPDALEVIHNQFKLDTDVEPCTRIYNSLMLAYAACNMPRRALDFWHEISTSPEGPTYNSLSIAFRVCEALPFGDKTARAIWNKLMQADIEIDKSLFATYVSCMARRGELDDLYKEMKRMKELTGEEPDANTLGSIFNACYGLTTQYDIERYIRKTYPTIWTKLEGKGIEEDEKLGTRQIRGIDRTLKT